QRAHAPEIEGRVGAYRLLEGGAAGVGDRGAEAVDELQPSPGVERVRASDNAGHAAAQGRDHGADEALMQGDPAEHAIASADPQGLPEHRIGGGAQRGVSEGGRPRRTAPTGRELYQCQLIGAKARQIGQTYLLTIIIISTVRAEVVEDQRWRPGD